MKITAVIATRNRLPQLEVALPMMLAQEGLSEIIVVDDGSSDGTDKYLSGIQGIRVLRLPDKGYTSNPARTYHTGIDATDADVILWSGGEIAIPDPTACRRLAEGLTPTTIHIGRVYNLPTPEGGEVGEDWDIDPTARHGLHKDAPAVYSGAERPVPFMFLAAFHRALWVRLGGYDRHARAGTDGEFARRAGREGVTFLGKGSVLAYHLRHAKR